MNVITKPAIQTVIKIAKGFGIGVDVDELIK